MKCGTMAWAVAVSLLVKVCGASFGETFFADTVFVPPAPAKSSSAGADQPMPADLVDYYVDRVFATHTFYEFAGQNDALRNTPDDSKLFAVARSFPVDLESASLFGNPIMEGGDAVYLAAVASADATALRLRVDFSGLTSGQELWVLDPTGSRAFGPYLSSDASSGGRLLPTTIGDTAVLMVRSLETARPALVLTEIAHFFQDLEALKLLACGINIACETDPNIQLISTAIGLVFVPYGNEVFAGSGALINIPDTPELEPYFLTGYHVVSDPAAADNVDVLWDYRTTVCGASEAPPLARLPHSRGVMMLAASATLDATLLRLDSVPGGVSGRAYLGWDSRPPAVGESVIVMHHPSARPMQIAYGRVEDVDQPVSSYLHETRVGWLRGVTEPGSSGSCLLYVRDSYRIAGTLTGGSAQTCDGGPDENWDYFSSFRSFFGIIAPAYMKQATGFTSITRPERPAGEGEGETSRAGCAAPPKRPRNMGCVLDALCILAAIGATFLAGRARNRTTRRTRGR